MPKGEPGLYVDYCAKDFLDGTQMLDPWEELAYRRICDMIYVTNDRLIDDDRKLAWATKTGRRWPAIKASLTGGEKPKLQVINGRITNVRCQSALGRAAKKIAQKVVAGTASAASGKSLENLKRHRTDVPKSVRGAVATDDRTNQRTKEASKKEEAPPSGGAACARDTAEMMLGIWREECGDLFGSPTKISDSRIKKCSARLRNDLGNNIESWRLLCQRVRRSTYFSEKWNPSIDWVLEPGNMLKIQEGNYDERHVRNGRRQSAHEAEFAAFDIITR